MHGTPAAGGERRIVFRYRYFFLLPAIFVCCFFFMVNNRGIDVSYLKHERQVYNAQNIDVSSKDRYTIRTEGCIIPGMNPLSEDTKPHYGYPTNMQSCPHANYSFFENNKTHIWTNKNNMKYHNVTNPKEVKCCYKSFYRENAVSNVYATNIDDRATYRNCVNFTDIVEVKDEFVKVSCTFQGKDVYNQFFLFAPNKSLILYDGAKEAPKNKSSYNVIILGIDAVSRLNFHRTMPKTLDYLLKKGAVEMLGYNKVGDNSFPNVVPLLMGYKHTEIKKICRPFERSTFDFCPFIWHTFKDAGFYTAFAEDSSYLGTFNYVMDGFTRTPTDYYPHTFIHQAERNAGRVRDWNPYLCMKDKFFYKVLLDYTEDVIITLKSKRLFGFFWEVTMSHDYLNYPIIMDDSYEKFFKRLEASKYLDESIIILLSDHGIRWGGIRSTKQGRLEERLPFVYVLTPPSFRENYSEAFKNLKLNGHRLTTPFDVHEMLEDLVDLDNIKNEKILNRTKENYSLKRGISMFMPIPSNRTCKMAAIDEHWCTCHTGNKISTKSKEAISAAENLINSLNFILKEQPECAKLSLAEVTGASEIVAGRGGKQDVWRDYMVVVRASPGNGVFEATMRYDTRNWTLSGTASRLNQYGDQSRCVHHPQLKLYCYCK